MTSMQFNTYGKQTSSSRLVAVHSSSSCWFVIDNQTIDSLPFTSSRTIVIIVIPIIIVVIPIIIIIQKTPLRTLETGPETRRRKRSTSVSNSVMVVNV
jgi:hypothetical protein